MLRGRKVNQKELEEIKDMLRKGRIGITSQDRLSDNYTIAEEFFRDILKYDIKKCLVTDLSSLTDYPESLNTYKKRIKEKYGISVGAGKEKILVNIFDKIKEK